MWVVKPLQERQLIVHHPLVVFDVFLQDDLHGDLARGAISLPNDSVGTGTLFRRSD